MNKRTIVLATYFLVLFIPIYWMVVTSFKTDQEIMSEFTLVPGEVTFDNYAEIFESDVWRSSFINSLMYVLLNVVITVSVAVPAAYAFSRWTFRGSHHLFFWLLTIACPDSGPARLTSLPVPGGATSHRRRERQTAAPASTCLRSRSRLTKSRPAI